MVGTEVYPSCPGMGEGGVAVSGGGTEVCPSCPGTGEGGVAVSGGGRNRGVSLLSRYR